MALQKTPKAYQMLPYRKGGPIDYASLDFEPDVWEWPPDHMEQSKEIAAVFTLLSARFTDFHARHDVFVDMGTNICYDPTNLNVRIAPDVYVAFGVDELSIRPRRIYLPWEVGKVPRLGAGNRIGKYEAGGPEQEACHLHPRGCS